MAVTLTNFNVTPYNDDYATTKNFHRVMFRPSFAVQARELTQLQTILQEQINKIGSHVFEQGSMVIPGDINIDMEYDYIQLESTFNAETVETYRTEFQDKILESTTTGLKARVITTVAATDTDPLTLYIKYENTGTDGVTQTFKAGETITSTNANNTTATNFKLTTNQTTVRSAQIGSNSTSVGVGSAVLVHAGVYFVNGFFVENTEQIILLEKYSNRPSFRVGWQISESFVTPEEDSSLLDNAQGASNVNAPGAHRFKIILTLVKKSLTATDDTDFIELARIVKGNIQKFVKYSDYSQLEHTLARRTFDESGNYEVRPFKLEKREHLNDGTNRGVFLSTGGGLESKVAFSIEPGKAYVEGYELETMGSQIVPVDKPRTFDREVDRPIQTPVGNFQLVENVSGIPNINAFEEVALFDDLGGNPGGGTQVGTARVRAFSLHDGDYTATVGTVKFKLGLFDVNMNTGKDFDRDVKSFDGANFLADVSPTQTTLFGTASIPAQSGSPAVVTITGVGTLFNTELKTGDYVFINGTRLGPVTVVNNLEATVTYLGSAITGGQIKRFNARIEEANNKPLVFDSNFFRLRKVRGDSTTNPDNEQSTSYTLRRQFTPQTVQSNEVQFSVTDNEAFASGSNLQNYTLVITSSSNASSIGNVLTIRTSDITVSGGGLTVTFSNLNSLTTPAANGDGVALIASVDVSSTAATEKTKTLVENHTTTITTSAATALTNVTLGKADGFKLHSVKMATAFGTYSTTNQIDITDRYTFDTGMRDAFYGLASIRLKPGQPVPTGSIRVTFDFFTHGAGDYFSVDSYTGQVTYENIPTFISKDSGTSFELRDCFDFRPRVDDNGTFAGATASITELPFIGTNLEADFSFFLGRKDLIFMDRVGKFNIIEGVPSLTPTTPQAPDSGMVLFETTMSPYVIGLDEINIRKLDNRRYTMRDIGKLDKRITNLEYYTSLNLLEKEAASLVLKDSDGNDRLKNGFIVDNFTGHAIGDYESPDYKIAVDFQKRLARPMAFSDNVNMIETLSSASARASSGYVKHEDGIITLPFTEVSYIENPYASDSFDVNPYKVAPFTGEMTLVPYSDDWQDVTRRPDVVIDDDNNFDVINRLAEEMGVTGTVWNSWQNSWFGERQWTGTESSSSTQRRFQNGGIATIRTTTTRAVGTQQVGQTRSGIETSIQSSVDSHNMGDRIVGINMIPFMRSRPVSVFVANMRPNTKVFAFFDNENVTDFFRPDDVFTVTSGTRANFDFNNTELPGPESSTDSARFFNGDAVQAFGFGDIIKNQTHTATNVTGVVKNNDTTATITLASVSGIAVGHHVQFSNIGGSTRLNFTTSRNNNYIVTGVSGSTITIQEIDGSALGTIASYSSGGSCQRLQASAHVVAQVETLTSTELPVDIRVNNVQNGFAISDNLSGSVPRTTDGGTNLCQISGINGSTSSTTVPSMNVDTTNIVTDDDGKISGVFTIPNSDSLRFRTGERVLRLIDNINNNPETGLHSSKAEKIYSATGIAEEREQTILNVRRAEFVRDRVQDTRVISRDVRGAASTRSQVIAFQSFGDGGDGGGGNGHDPLGQTFISEGVNGAFVTSIDLFFQTRGTRPVYVQLVNAVDGHPSLKILAQKIIDAKDVNVSDDASVPTRFTFPSPVYLTDDVEYAFVVKVDEPGCRVFFSEVGQTNLTDNRVISSNPLTGTLFLSQNGQAWTPHQYRDVKFTLNRAEFDTTATGNPVFVNSAVPKRELKANPFQCATGTNKVRVHHMNHGFSDADKVTFSGVADGFYGANSTTQGIKSDALNKQHSISELTIDTYVITLDNADITGSNTVLGNDFFGGSGVKATTNLAGDIIQPAISQLNFPQTSLAYRYTGMSTGYSKQAVRTVQENDNYYPPLRNIIASEENAVVKLTGGRANNIISGTSAKLEAIMTTTNSYLSPVIDTERVSLCMTSNRISNYTRASKNVTEIDDRALTASTGISFAGNTISATNTGTIRADIQTLDIGKEITISGSSNNNSTFTVTSVANDGASFTVTPSTATESAGQSVVITQHENYLDGIAPEGTSNEANYITKRFTLANPATALKILYEANRPEPSILQIYYKIAEEGDPRNFDDIPYVLSSTDVTDNPDENRELFREREHTISGLNSFSTVAVKFEFKSTSTVEVPKIKNLRVLALAL